MSSLTASTCSDSAAATGLFVVHSCPKAIVPHVEWALAREIGAVVKLRWEPQPLLPRMLRTEAAWQGPAGTAAAVASSLLGWQQVRFEITEDQSSAGDGGRWMHTPRLGIHRTQIDAAGNAVLTENAIRHAIEEAAGNASVLSELLNMRLGAAWDRELEPFRAAETGDASIFELPRLHAG